MTRSYSVVTEKFGTITIIADSIADARRRAKAAYGVGPRAVSRAAVQGDACIGCDSTPCVCGGG